jgi:hypothetical protein
VSSTLVDAGLKAPVSVRSDQNGGRRVQSDPIGSNSLKIGVSLYFLRRLSDPSNVGYSGLSHPVSRVNHYNLAGVLPQ